MQAIFIILCNLANSPLELILLQYYIYFTVGKLKVGKEVHKLAQSYLAKKCWNLDY